MMVNARKLLLASSLALLPLSGLLAADREQGKSADATSSSIAALKKDLGNPASLEVDEVRVTRDGVTCIDYRIGDGQGGKSLGHAVVQNGEVLKSSSKDERFEKEWNEHCLGPRGGISGVE